MPKEILLVIRKVSYATSIAAEGLRIASAMVAMDILPQLLFIDDGVYCLLKDQRLEAAGLNSYYERLKTLADFVGVYAVRDSMTERNLRAIDLGETFSVKLLSIDEAATLIMENKTVVTF